MLKNLYIENIAVIEKADIDFSGGFQVLTGETGAGKSIIIDSLNAVLGQRTSKELIRTGCDTACVSALFADLGDDAVRELKEAGYEPDDDGALLVRRVLSLGGNGTVKINGKTATVGVLRGLAKYLVNIHGQHDNQGLLDSDNHYRYLDMFADDGDTLFEYYSVFKQLNSVRRNLASLETDEDDRQRKTELLKYQIDELTRADVHIGEYELLKQKLAAADGCQTTLDKLKTAQGYLIGDDDTDGAVTLVKNAVRTLLSLRSEQSDGAVQKLSDAEALLEGAVDDISDLAEKNVFSPDETEKIRERLDLLYKIMLKYGGSEEAALQCLTNAERELDNIGNTDADIARLSDELDRLTERLVDVGKNLTVLRIKAAEKLSKKVTETLRSLDMPKATFEVRIEQGRYTKVGCDVVEFFIGTNVGENIKPLKKIASGGELSRIMLAVKSALAKHDGVPTLIFDEIDSGISGHAAAKVGALMKYVAQNRQVLCVTHLAQIAAFADRHLFIEKQNANGRTRTAVTVLDDDGRIREIARIMSGGEITENLYNSAKELLDRSKENNGNL